MHNTRTKRGQDYRLMRRKYGDLIHKQTLMMHSAQIYNRGIAIDVSCKKTSQRTFSSIKFQNGYPFEESLAFFYETLCAEFISDDVFRSYEDGYSTNERLGTKKMVF